MIIIDYVSLHLMTARLVFVAVITFTNVLRELIADIDLFGCGTAHVLFFF